MGPYGLFGVVDQEKSFTMQQIFQLSDADEDIGMDFTAFYFLYRCLLATK